MSTLKDIGLKHSYTGKGEKILDGLLLPALDVATRYDRVTSFYTVDSLLAISQGVQSLYERGGRMRLVIGIHSFPEDMVDASVRRDHLRNQIEQIRSDIAAGVMSITDALEKKRLATLAWMIEDGLLEVRAAAVEGGIFHPKTLIFQDDAGNKVAAIGSSNETGSGLGGNYEQVLVVNSWDLPDAVEDQEAFFASLWNNESEDATVIEVNEEVASLIRESLGDEYRNPHQSTNMQAHPVDSAMALAARMPANFFVSGEVPALFQHQERAAIDALSRWPVRVLLGDEVGLGKTFEAAAVATYLVKYCGVHRVLILTPKAVLQQWQDELSDNFGIEAWLYDSAAREYRSPSGAVKKIGNANPIGSKAPDVMLMSAQYARGGAGRKTVFERVGAILPDLLVLDEAHSARVSKDISGKRKPTRMYTMLEGVLQQIPHVVFATATPMQRDAEEYHAMLKLLGIPKPWRNARSYMTSLNLIADAGIPGTDDAYKAGKLLRSTVRMMQPSLDLLEDGELAALNGLMALGDEADSFDVASYVQDAWHDLQGAFIKLHPAQLLTVRNTRRSLEGVGYRFPRRILSDEPVTNSDQVQLFYRKVEDYISGYFFSVEKALNPDKNLNTGFVRISYQQRVASSLHSCRESLRRRLNKVKSLDATMAKSGIAPKDAFSGFAGLDELDDIDQDESIEFDEDLFDKLKAEDGNIDLGKLKQAIDLEMTSLSPLIKEADGLLSSCGDMKVSKSIELAIKHLEAGDKVLLFSRYTDTVDALIGEFERTGGSQSYIYGVYDGSRSIVVSDDVKEPVTKKEIKDRLADGELRLMICSDAASEGLNLQAARVLINVDVPWTPARLEQRIGRVARLGQNANEVEIYNVWYPNSVEARMYRRINKRLDETNIAVGEFPEVIADGIRNAILEDREQEDDSLTALQEYRNSVQTRALERLWSTRVPGITTSGHIRRGLIEICDTTLTSIDERQNGTMRLYGLPDGSREWYTAQDGCAESVSFGANVWKQIDFELDSFGVIEDDEGNPAAFVMGNDASKWISHEYLTDVILDKPVGVEAVADDRPTMLADNGALSLEFAIEAECPRRPHFWPPHC